MPFELPFTFTQYLIGINIAGFVLFLINTILYNNTKKGQIDGLLTVAALLGGSLGIVISIFTFDRKAVKQNMMSRVFVFCVLVIQIVLVLILKSEHRAIAINTFTEFLANHKILLIYLGLINLVAFIAYGFDKLMAIEGGSRIRIVTLLCLAFIGGSLGALAAMHLFHHKTSKDYFSVGVPLIILMHVFVLTYLIFFR